MKENVLGILMYLFVNHMENATEAVNFTSDQLIDELTENGFTKKAIHCALNWLSRCLELSESSTSCLSASNHALRILSPDEKAALSVDCQAFIMNLIANNTIPQPALEITLQLVLELNLDAIDTNLIKWVMLITLYNLPEHEEALKHVEFLVLNNLHNEDTVH